MPNNSYPDYTNSQFDIQYAKRKILSSDLLATRPPTNIIATRLNDVISEDDAGETPGIDTVLAVNEDLTGDRQINLNGNDLSINDGADLIFRFQENGGITAGQYGAGIFLDSAPEFILGVDADGNFVEVDPDSLGGSSYTDEQAQDAVGNIFVDSDTIDFTYNDATPSVTAVVRSQFSITSDTGGIKLVNDAATPGNSKYYGTDGTGAKGWYSLPSTGTDTNFATNDLTATGDRTHTFAAFSVQINGTQTGSGKVLGITNTSSGHAIVATASGAGYGIFATGFRGVYGVSTTGYGVRGNATSGNALYGSTTTGITLVATRTPATFNDVTPITSLERFTSGNSGFGANGIGSSLQYSAPTATNTAATYQGDLRLIWTDATHATRTSQFELWLTNSAAAAARKLALAGSGQLTLDGYGAGTLTTDASGNVTASSDIQLKQMINFYENGIESLMKIQPIVYKWNERSGFEMNQEYIGFSAQNIQSAIGELAVGKDPNGYLTIQDRSLIATLVNCVQQQQKEIELLKNKLNENN